MKTSTQNVNFLLHHQVKVGLKRNHCMEEIFFLNSKANLTEIYAALLQRKSKLCVVSINYEYEYILLLQNTYNYLTTKQKPKQQTNDDL